MSSIKMLKISSIVVLLHIISGAVAQRPDYFEDLRGPYCEQKRLCCTGRVDSCAVPIHRNQTLCYCDNFCVRGTSGDCCPDYESFCLGIAPPEDFLEPCVHKGKKFFPGETIEDNCNTCKCVNISTTQAVSVCDTNLCLADEDLFNSLRREERSLGWHHKNYTQFYGKKFNEALMFYLGTYEPRHRRMHSLLPSKNQQNFERHFDAFEVWPGKITPAIDQGWCGSSWAVSTATMASDRYKILSDGVENVELSVQHLLSCVPNQNGCRGGSLDKAWNFFRKSGVVDEECFRYTAKEERCRINSQINLNENRCFSSVNENRTDFYRMGPAYRLKRESQIMEDIKTKGPVQAIMRVYRDFYAYSSGIYQRASNYATKTEEYGYHSVRLAGWGENHEGVKYWLAVNSWGTQWGENGRFRIKRGTNECEIESYILGSLPLFHDETMKDEVFGGRKRELRKRKFWNNRRKRQHNRI